MDPSCLDPFFYLLLLASSNRIKSWLQLNIFHLCFLELHPGCMPWAGFESLTYYSKDSSNATTLRKGKPPPKQTGLIKVTYELFQI